VLVRGETGVGKELVANRMHSVSGRPGGFVPVSAGELVDTLFQAQLFGHSDNAYSGAGKGAPGAFEHADRGTLFLDEMQTWAPSSQHALLRAVAERSIQRVRGPRRILTTCARSSPRACPGRAGRGRLPATCVTASVT
jgi:two-component system C4-dicarboxylate transport response regulator DctD